MARDIIVFRDRRKFVDWDKIYPNYGYLDANAKKTNNVSRETQNKPLKKLVVLGSLVALYAIIYISIKK